MNNIHPGMETKNYRKPPMTKEQKIKRNIIISVCLALVISFFIVLFIVIIPSILYNKADKLLSEGRYEEALEIYRDIGGFSNSEKHITVLSGINEVKEENVDEGIEKILSTGVSIKITYVMDGGSFSEEIPQHMARYATDLEIRLLSASSDLDISTIAETGIIESTYSSSLDFTGIPTPVKDGYRFVKWELETYNYYIEGSVEIKLNAIWGPEKYNIEYDLDGGTLDGKNVSEYKPDDEAFTVINPNRKGYTFAGWIGTGLSKPTINLTIDKESYGDRVYTATWMANEYTIIYDTAGGTISSKTQKVYYDSNVEYLIPERAGYKFLGWYENDIKRESEKWTRTSDLSLVAKWEILGYTIQYELNGGTNHADNPENYTVDTDSITLKYPSRIGYTFAGWIYEGQETPIKDAKIEKGSVDNKTFTANWEAITTTVTFNVNSGVCGTTALAAKYDQSLALPEATRSGYTFLGWFNNGTKYESGIWTNYTDIELTAEWEIISYNIEYDFAGGSDSGKNPDSYNVEQEFSLIAPLRAGYNFLGWTYEGQTTPINEITVLKGSTGDKTYTANWKAISSTITLDPNGGNCNPVTIPVIYDQVFDLPEPEWEGHTFSGWYIGNTKIEGGKCTFTEDTIIVAEWDIVNYNISYAMNGGTNPTANPSKYNYHDTITLEEPTCVGYSFVGWTYEGEPDPVKVLIIEPGTTGDKVYTANWEANTYTVGFDANGGTVTQTSIEVTFDTEVTLPIPERKGYTFEGWFFGNREYTTGIWKNDSGVTLIAKWTANSYTVTYDDVSIKTNNITVTFDSNYSGSTPSMVTLTNGQTLTYPTNPTRSGYYFNGWFTNSSCTTAYTFSGTIPEDMTLYAGWTSSVANNTTMSSWSYSSGVYTSTNKGNYSNSNYTITATMPITVTFSYKTSSEQKYDILYIKKNGTTLQSCSGSTSYVSYMVTLNAGDTLTFSYSKDGSQSSGYDCAYIKDLTYTPDVSYISTATASCSTVAGLVYDTTSTHVITVTFDENVTLLEPSRVGYTFDGWYYNGNKVGSYDWKIDANATLTARWTKNQYTVTLDANGGTDVDASQTVTYDSSYTLPTPTRLGYAFDGWFCGTDQYSGGTWLTPEHITLVAKWTPRTDISYVVNHYQQNANDDECILESTENLTGTADAEIIPDVKSFEHFVSPTAQTVIIAPDGSLVVNYYYDRVTYDLTYVTNGGETIDKQTYKYEQTLVIATPTRRGYTFGGWFADATLATAYSATDTLNADTTIYAYWTEENKPTDFTYSGTSAVTVSGYTGTSTTMWIPAYIGGVPVTTIPASAFKDQTSLLKIVVPDTVISIGLGAFKGCAALKDITLPFVGNTATATSYNAVFGYIFGYQTVSGGSSDSSYSSTYIDQQYGNKTDSIWQYTCRDNYVGTSNSGYTRYYSFNSYYYYIPATIENVTITMQTVIPVAAFNNCDFIETITLPTTVTSIGGYAFQNCHGLTEMNLGDALTSLGGYAFAGSMTLEKVTMPETVETIGSYAFNNCVSLKNVNGTANGELNIPNKVKTVSSYAFQNCTLFTKVDIGTATTIGEYAFSGCSGITEVTGGELTTIGNYSFSGCSSIEKFNTSNANELNIHNGVTSIGEYTFRNVSLITKIIVPDTVTSIGLGAFKGCAALKDITLPFVGNTATATSYNAVFGYIFGYQTVSGGSSDSSYSSTYIDQQYGNKTDSIWQYTCRDNYVGTSNSGYTRYYSFNSYYYYIPATIENVTITMQTVIPVAAFNNCDFIKTITLPTTVTSIGDYAFQNCSATVNQTYVPKTDMPWDGTTIASGFDGGTGTQFDPYIIRTAAQFAYLAQQVNSGTTYDGVYFKLMSNLNLNNKSFAGIGNSATNAFAGIFNGNGYTIKNVKITSSASYVGLFGYLKGTVKHLGVESITISASGASAHVYVGALVGYNKGTIENCYTRGTVTATSAYITHIGGIAGYNDGTITNSFSTANVNGTSTDFMVYAGGVTGYHKSGVISGCYATGNITAKGTTDAYSRNGGFAGFVASGATVTNCYRYTEQVLTQNSTVGSAYCEEGTSASLEAIKAYVSANWNSDIWSFNNSHPRFIEK